MVATALRRVTARCTVGAVGRSSEATIGSHTKLIENTDDFIGIG